MESRQLKLKLADTSADLVFLLEDGTYLHLEFQTRYKKKDLFRFCRYNLNLSEIYEKDVKTVIIYSSRVNDIEPLNTSTTLFTPTNIMMNNYDGDTIFKELELKVKEKQRLIGTDVMSLALLPLMKNNIPKRKMAEKTVIMANTIEDETQRDLCIASAIAFAAKYLTKKEMKEFKEVMMMSNINILDEIVKDKEIEIAIRAIKKGLSVEDIADLTGLEIEEIEELQEELEEEKK